MPPSVNPLLEVADLAVHFSGKAGVVQAVDGVSFEVAPGETLGLVGESGCGKTTTGRAILRLVEPTSGTVRLAGEDWLSLKGNALRERRRNVQMVFQDPYGSLDPRMTVLDVVAEPLRAHGVSAVEADRTVREMLDRCGLSSRLVRRYPHEFSGGQRQRVAIARALVLRPALLVCDEPVSALDVSIRAQVLNLLVELQRELSLTYVFIAHDLAAVRHVSDRIAVMYLGRIVEMAGSELLSAPAHPYTKALLSAVPIPDPAIQRNRRRIVLQGEPPSPLNPPAGCRFHPRCPLLPTLAAADANRCRTQEPTLRILGQGHTAACHFA